MQKHVFSICWQRMPKSAFTSDQSDQGLCSPLTELLGAVEYDHVKQNSGWVLTHSILDTAKR